MQVIQKNVKLKKQLFGISFFYITTEGSYLKKKLHYQVLQCTEIEISTNNFNFTQRFIVLEMITIKSQDEFLNTFYVLHITVTLTTLKYQCPLGDESYIEQKLFFLSIKNNIL